MLYMKNSNDINLLSCLLQLLIIDVNPIYDHGNVNDDDNDDVDGDEMVHLEIH